MEEFTWRVLEISIPIVGAVIVWALGMLGRWLSSRTTNERLRTLITTVQDAATTAVTATQQAYISGLEREPGTPLSDEQKKEALSRALAACKSVLGTKGLAAVQAAIGFGQAELEVYLTAQIESAVANEKKVAK